MQVVDAFKLVPIHPSQWHLCGVKWNGAYYFYPRLVFGSCSSPTIFDWLSQAVCWIAKHNYGIELNLLPNIDLAWLRRFTRCNRLGHTQVARYN